ncbi:MAG: hypothetical protein ACMXYF_00155 [Candidatus Woesearchaeota archaeon]
MISVWIILASLYILFGYAWYFWLFRIQKKKTLEQVVVLAVSGLLVSGFLVMSYIFLQITDALFGALLAFVVAMFLFGFPFRVVSAFSNRPIWWYFSHLGFFVITFTILGGLCGLLL